MRRAAHLASVHASGKIDGIVIGLLPASWT